MVTIVTSGPIGLATPNNKSVLEIIQNACTKLAVPIPVKLIGETDRVAVELLSDLRETCNELARRVDWGALRTSAQLTGTGAKTTYQLPSNFLRLIQGNAVRSTSGTVRGGLTPDEWSALGDSVGTARYFLLQGTEIQFWPYPSDAVTVEYQARTWNANGLDYVRNDDDVVLLPPELVEMGVVWRRRRHVGQQYADHMAEYEAALVDYANFDIGERSP